MTSNNPSGASSPKNELLVQVSRFPENPGVYIMKNSADVPVYIGKALNLRSRVRSYFSDSHDNRINIPVMLRTVDHIDWIATTNETEALILEANLIRKHLPKYNVDLRDDKHFPYLKITLFEQYPRLLVVRRVEKDGARYFGPYTDATSMRRLMAFSKRIFKLRDCKKHLPLSGTVRPCINYSIHRCNGPCCGYISQQDYLEQAMNCIKFLSGKRGDLVVNLEKKMTTAAAELRFEDAASLRDQINLIKDASRLQTVDLKLDDTDFDVFGIADGDRGICMAVLQFRDGLLVNSRHFLFAKSIWCNSNPSHDNLFVRFYLDRSPEPPPVVLIPYNAGFSHESLQLWIDQQFTKKTTITVPQRGTRKLLMLMAEKNAFLFLNQNIVADGSKDCEDLEVALKLPVYPEIIEAFDISNLGSSFTVAGMVRFKNGMPEKSGYRRYKIKSVDGQNDFAMMMEVVSRRLKRLKNEDTPFPHLLLIDGGPGQLHAAQKALESFEKPPLIASLAKQEEILYAAHLAEPVKLPASHPARKLVERIRDEVHRYAITYHRNIRGKQFTASKLEQIKGIGRLRAAKLLKKFGSLRRAAAAPVEELMQVAGISKETAGEIKKVYTGG